MAKLFDSKKKVVTDAAWGLFKRHGFQAVTWLS